jgi:hypothetical protein
LPEPAAPPPVRVTLPDGEVRGVLHERRQWERGGWMYLVGIRVWTNTADEQVVPAEFRAWLTPGVQVHAIDGIDYSRVPSYPLADGSRSTLDPNRWTWKLQRTPPGNGRPGSVVVHEWNCSEAPADEPEIDLQAALDTVTHTPRATLCEDCAASVSLTPLVDPDYRSH